MSFKVISVNISKNMSPVLMINSMLVPICNHFHAGQANIGKNNHFLVGTLFDTRVRRPC